MIMRIQICVSILKYTKKEKPYVNFYNKIILNNNLSSDQQYKEKMLINFDHINIRTLMTVTLAISIHE